MKLATALLGMYTLLFGGCALDDNEQLGEDIAEATSCAGTTAYHSLLGFGDALRVVLPGNCSEHLTAVKPEAATGKLATTWVSALPSNQAACGQIGIDLAYYDRQTPSSPWVHHAIGSFRSRWVTTTNPPHCMPVSLSRTIPATAHGSDQTPLYRMAISPTPQANGQKGVVCVRYSPSGGPVAPSC